MIVKSTVLYVLFTVETGLKNNTNTVVNLFGIRQCEFDKLFTLHRVNLFVIFNDVFDLVEICTFLFSLDFWEFSEIHTYSSFETKKLQSIVGGAEIVSIEFRSV